MVQNIGREKTMKEKLYDIATNIGMKLFAEYWGKASLKATDRWIEYPWALESLSKPPCKILDVGCAGSMFPLILKAFKYDIWGLDIRQYPSVGYIRFRKRDVCDTRFCDDIFDAIIAISTIEHIEDDFKAIQEIHRILQPKGLFLMTVPFASKSKQTKFHRIYDMFRLQVLLKDFKTEIEIVDSPETDNYKLALIRATK